MFTKIIGSFCNNNRRCGFTTMLNYGVIIGNRCFLPVLYFN